MLGGPHPSVARRPRPAHRQKLSFARAAGVRGIDTTAMKKLVRLRVGWLEYKALF